jgi:hypothetical protein
VFRRAFSSDAPDQKLSSASFSSRRGPMRGVPSVATAILEAEIVEEKSLEAESMEADMA